MDLYVPLLGHSDELSDGQLAQPELVVKEEGFWESTVLPCRWTWLGRGARLGLRSLCSHKGTKGQRHLRGNRTKRGSGDIVALGSSWIKLHLKLLPIDFLKN